MARRPIFIPEHNGQLVDEILVDFEWFPGMSLKQKQRSVEALHRMAKDRLGVERPLEVSSKSDQETGVRLSSFNLRFTTQKGRTLTVEAAFQGSKVFAFGGPFRDIFDLGPKDAKRDIRLKESGALIGFNFFGTPWPLEPRTSFYDWLYINALLKNPELAEEARFFDGYTDIEFNPDRSVNCQARSVALYRALVRTNRLEGAMSSPEDFRAIYREGVAEPRHVNYHTPLL